MVQAEQGGRSRFSASAHLHGVSHHPSQRVRIPASSRYCSCSASAIGLRMFVSTSRLCAIKLTSSPLCSFIAMLSRLGSSSCARCSQLSFVAANSRLFSTSTTGLGRNPLEQGAALWKGKGKASEAPRTSGTKWSGLYKMRGARTAATTARTSAMSGASTTDEALTSTGPAYAHEDLLSRTPSHHTPRRSTARPGYFSRSFLAPEAPLPPPSTSPLVPLASPVPQSLPQTVLSNGLPNPDIRWRPKPLSTVSDDLALYKTLAKAKLSALVVLTTMAGYAMCPVDPTSTHAAMDAFAQQLSSTLPAGTSLDAIAGPLATSVSSSPANNLTLSVLLPAAVGTALCSASAATFNELIEAPYDAQMARTRARPLPRRYMTPLQASTFGALTGVVGVGTLYAINPLAASLGLGTILLYCPLYTIAKRHTIYNTWLGAVVGSIPPLIGWAACTDSLSPWTQPGAYAFFALLFFWQFPHFMALSHTLRSSYASSGYRMLAVLDPAKNALVGLRYSLALIPLCATFPALGLTNAVFPWLASVPNGIMAVTAWRFWRKREDRRAKLMFWASLVHLPVVLIMAMLCKKGLWGPTEEEEDEDEQDRVLEGNEAVKLG